MSQSNYNNRIDLSKKNTYVFSVPATYFYEIDADSEEEARKLLEEEGGMDIMGALGEITHKDYMNATLEETWSSDS
tara:strand:- start:269 stop:496 length:228 start_codon:yes stop_codon:yes gene_type:complete